MWLKNCACHAHLKFEFQKGVASTVFEPHLWNFGKICIFYRSLNDISTIFGNSWWKSGISSYRYIEIVYFLVPSINTNQGPHWCGYLSTPTFWKESYRCLKSLIYESVNWYPHRTILTFCTHTLKFSTTTLQIKSSPVIDSKWCYLGITMFSLRAVFIWCIRLFLFVFPGIVWWLVPILFILRADYCFIFQIFSSFDVFGDSCLFFLAWVDDWWADYSGVRLKCYAST